MTLQNSYKRYEPEYTQLPFKFIDKNISLRKLIRTKGCTYLAYYIAIQDSMASHVEEEFTLSFDEKIDAIREELCLYSSTDDEITEWINTLIAADIVKQKYFINPYDDSEMERYFIPAVAEALEEAKEAWITKCINPNKKLSKEDKAKIAEYRQNIREVDKQLRNLANQRNRNEALLDHVINEKPFDEARAKEIRSDLDIIRSKNASLYKEKRSYEKLINDIKIARGAVEDEE